jgi:disulfide bond formation protein DsbB
MPEGILAQLGIDVSVAFAGLAGGVVGAWADGKASLTTWVAYALCGALTAIYLAGGLTQVIPFISSKPTAGFIVGACALIIVRAILAAARKWQPSIFNGTGKAPPP